MAKLQAAAMGGQASATKNAVAPTDDLTGAMGGLTGATKNGADATNDWLTAQAKLIDLMLGARGSQNDYEAAIDDADKALKENGRTLDVHTAKGRANRQALDDIARSGIEYVESLRDQGKGQDTLNSKMSDIRGEFIKVAAEMTGSEKKAKKLADQLGLIPNRIPVKVLLKVGGDKGVKTVYSAGDGGMKFTAFAAGGDHRARQLMLVGEHGPELREFSAPGHIYTATQTRSMLSRATQSPAPVVVKFPVGYPADRLINARQIYDDLVALSRSWGGRPLVFSPR